MVWREQQLDSSAAELDSVDSVTSLFEMKYFSRALVDKRQFGVVGHLRLCASALLRHGRVFLVSPFVFSACARIWTHIIISWLKSDQKVHTLSTGSQGLEDLGSAYVRHCVARCTMRRQWEATMILVEHQHRPLCFPFFGVPRLLRGIWVLMKRPVALDFFRRMDTRQTFRFFLAISACRVVDLGEGEMELHRKDVHELTVDGRGALVGLLCFCRAWKLRVSSSLRSSMDWRSIGKELVLRHAQSPRWSTLDDRNNSWSRRKHRTPGICQTRVPGH